MKQVLILFAAVIGFAACSEEGNDPNFDFANEVVNSYTQEQIEGLIAGFDAKTIDYGKLKSDLTSGSIYNTRTLYSTDGITWGPETNLLGGDLSTITSANWIFEDDGDCERFVRTVGHSTGIEPPRNSLYEGRWHLDREQQMVVASVPMEHCPEFHFRLKVVYYNSPLLIFDQTAHSTADGDFDLIICRHRVNLRALSHDKVEAIFEERMAENK